MGKDKSAEKKKDKAEGGQEADFVIKPQSIVPPIDTSKWPLLLKNYDKLNVSAMAAQRARCAPAAAPWGHPRRRVACMCAHGP